MSEWQYRSQIELSKQAPNLGLGFQIRDIPEALYRCLRTQLANNIERFEPEPGNPFMGTTNTRGIPALIHRDPTLDERIFDTLQPLLEAWCGLELVSSSVYGIRVYQRGSYLHPHVDQSRTHVISATLCIAHELEAGWPLSIQNHGGELEPIDLEPGCMIFYESSRLLHGRRSALQGRYYASMFCHFAPLASAPQSHGTAH